MEKMTLEKAMEIVQQKISCEYGVTSGPFRYDEAVGFIQGYESRDAEVDRLKKAAEEEFQRAEGKEEMVSGRNCKTEFRD